ncbi:MAG: alpha/beta hydrolase family protein [Candidatus Brocadiia bacterium]|jgi:hypothetical protein|nr:alpha/beta hydrolase family protein [Candidatus Brocadiia bacterium]
MAGQFSEAGRFSVLPHLCARFDAVGRKLAFKAEALEEWRRWRTALRRKLKELTGYATMQAAPLEPRVTERVEVDEFVRERVEIRTEPGVIMPLYVIRLKELEGRRLPAVICPHGHGSGGKVSTAGRSDIPEVAEAIKQYNGDYGLQFARAGFITFCPDARGFGERREAATPDPMKYSCEWINHMALPLGQTVTGMWAWDLSRLIDYVETREDCLRGGVGCAGLSGGGLQTLWLSALDDRVRCAVVSGYLYGYKESLLVMHTNCSCNYVPRLYEYADMGDIAALIAPRPLLVETGSADHLNGASGLKNVRLQVAAARRAYRLLGAQKALKHDIFDGPHMWHGVQAVPWMQRWMGRDAGEVDGDVRNR